MQIATGPTSAAGPAPASGPFFQDTSFAGILASVAGPQNGETSWNDDQLAEDVATIGYERALRAHARVRPGDSDREAVPGLATSVASGPPDRDPGSHLRSLKKSSITIRLSETDCAQLRTRATEAGLSVSAYLRSCTLEVESLRAQVKEALVELRNSTSHPAIQESKTESIGGFAGVLHRVWDWFRLIGPRRRPAIRLNPANPFAPSPY